MEKHCPQFTFTKEFLGLPKNPQNAGLPCMKNMLFNI